MHHLSTDLKLRAILYYLQTSNYVETAAVFKVPRTTLMRWVDKYTTENTVSRKKREYIAYKVHVKHVQKVTQILKREPTITMKQLSEKLRDEYNDFNITPQWLGEVIRDNNLTRKRTRINHQPETRYNKEINIKDELKTFYTKIKAFPINKIISIDESSIEPFRAKSYSRCQLGKRCVITTKDNIVFQKFSLILAATTSGPLRWEMFDKGSVFAERLEDFLQKLLENKKGFLVLLDNSPVHKKKSIEEIVKKTGNTLLYTVPYQPKTNAVEQIFSELKHHLSDSVTRKFSELQMTVAKILEDTIPKEHYLNHFVYAYGEKNERTKEPSTRHRITPKYKTV